MAEEQGEIDPRIFQFTWDLNAECNWDEISGVGINDLDLKDPKHLRWIIYCGLKDNVYGITLTDVGKMVQPDNSFEIYKTIFKKMSTAQTGDPEKKEGPPVHG